MSSFRSDRGRNYRNSFTMMPVPHHFYGNHAAGYDLSNIHAAAVQAIEQDYWGRLIKKERAFFRAAYQKTLKPGENNDVLNIFGPQLKVGRDPACHYVIAKDDVLDFKLWQKISKTQFILYQDIQSDDHFIFIKDLSRNGTFVNHELIGKNQQQLIKSGDVISIVEAGLEVFTFKDLTTRKEVDVPKEVCDKFFVGEKLGSGTFGVVYKVYDRKVNPFAVKYVKSNIMTSRPNSMVSDNEINIMKILNHVCIIKTIDVMMSDLGACLVLEYMTGGDLLTRIIESPNRRLTEDQSRCFFYQITEAVNYLHNKGITHRDIKPDNILLKDHEEYTLVKITDFGLSKLVVKGTFMTSLLGTPTYTAPEVLQLPENESYTSKVDIWSMGVMLFAMLSGTLPFAVEYGGDINKQVITGDYKFLATCWKEISQNALRLIKRMLIVAPETRIGINGIFEASWLHAKHDGVVKAKKIMEDNGGSITRIQSGLQRVKFDDEFAVPMPPPKRPRLEY